MSTLAEYANLAAPGYSVIAPGKQFQVCVFSASPAVRKLLILILEFHVITRLYIAASTGFISVRINDIALFESMLRGSLHGVSMGAMCTIERGAGVTPVLSIAERAGSALVNSW